MGASALARKRGAQVGDDFARECSDAGRKIEEGVTGENVSRACSRRPKASSFYAGYESGRTEPGIVACREREQYGIPIPSKKRIMSRSNRRDATSGRNNRTLFRRLDLFGHRE